MLPHADQTDELAQSHPAPIGLKLPR